MLLKQVTLDAIADGQVTLVFRNWKRPTVKSGGTLNTAVGQLSIESVEQIDADELDVHQAEAAGFDSIDELLASLRPGDDRALYRVRVRLSGADPRVELRQRAELSDDDLADLRHRLARMDRSIDDPGLEALQLLRLLAANEGVRAPDLADRFGVETKWFKARIRRLKALGLTESLRIGYRLSPRGRAVVDALS